jgi:hypothetical protein
MEGTHGIAANRAVNEDWLKALLAAGERGRCQRGPASRSGSLRCSSAVQLRAPEYGRWSAARARAASQTPIAGWLAGEAGDDEEAINTCGSAGGAMIAQVGEQSEQPAYQPATWTFTSPEGSPTIAGGVLRVSFFTPRWAGVRGDSSEQLRRRRCCRELPT